MSKQGRKRLRWIYYDAKYRCINPNHKRYHDYGGRGIQFLFSSFEEWFECIGPRPLGFEMDRINNDGPYAQGNVHWVDIPTQQKNKRIYKNNMSGIKGVSYIRRDDLWVARCNEQGNGKRRTLYSGKNYDEACSARLQWERDQSTI